MSFLAQLLATRDQFGIKSRVLWYFVEGEQTLDLHFSTPFGVFLFVTFAVTAEKTAFAFTVLDGKAANSPSL